MYNVGITHLTTMVGLGWLLAFVFEGVLLHHRDHRALLPLAAGPGGAQYEPHEYHIAGGLQ